MVSSLVWSREHPLPSSLQVYDPLSLLATDVSSLSHRSCPAHDVSGSSHEVVKGSSEREHKPDGGHMLLPLTLVSAVRHFRLFTHTQEGRTGKVQAWVDWDCVGHWRGCPLLSAPTCCALEDEVRYLPVKNETLRSRKASIFNLFQVFKLKFREPQLQWSVKDDRRDSSLKC